MGLPKSELTFREKKKTNEMAKLFVKLTKMSKNAVFFAGSRIRSGTIRVRFSQFANKIKHFIGTN